MTNIAKKIVDVVLIKPKSTYTPRLFCRNLSHAIQIGQNQYLAFYFASKIIGAMGSCEKFIQYQNFLCVTSATNPSTRKIQNHC